MHNPITAIILATLRKYPQGFNEYTLIQAIESAGLFDALDSNLDVALFQKHFLTMNALYQLQVSLWEEETLYLEISALRIHLDTGRVETNQIKSTAHTRLEGSTANNIKETLPEQSRNEALRSYYLDWSHYNSADEASVKQLLNSFWERFLNPEQRVTALNTLEISDNVPSPATIKQQFRLLAAKHHPDKGGDPDSFIAIREAYEILLPVR
ncbi:DNA-J related domain-containing protein [Neptunomonas japonica]|uniref:DNA-J related domain-containing protein n=1 Tax=Neptunomonas japonica TaxID=417574 RepID=UPI000426AD1B|nr:DNA-J related domain-containing protein [Neptunomonas japonica]